MQTPLAAAQLRACGVDEDTAAALVARINHGCQVHSDPADVWNESARPALSPKLPFAAHKLIHDFVFASWDPARGPVPVWRPGPDETGHSNIATLMKSRGIARYQDLYDWSVNDRAAFWQWATLALHIKFQTPPQQILDLSQGAEHSRWLAGAQYNIAESCFRGDAEAVALTWSAPGQGLSRMTRGDLHAGAQRIARGLQAMGLSPGDGVAIDMPMLPEAVVIYLGIVLAGMAVVSIADSMAPEEIATRLRIANAQALFTVHAIARGGKTFPLYDKILQAEPPRVVVLQAGAAALRAGDLSFEAFLPGDDVPAPAVLRDPEAITNILFSSGTTGEPKAIPWTQLTPIKAAIDGHLHLDIRPGDVVAWPTNLGWMMGPWLIYAALLNRATIALYNDAPTLADFGRFLQEARVTMLGLVPSIVKTWRSDDRMTAFDFSALRCFGSTGEASNADDYLYLMMLANYRPVIEYCGGTELGGGYITGTLVQPASPATFTTPALGSAFVLLDEQGQATNNGEVFHVPPTLGYSTALLNRDHHEVYFEGTPPGPGGVPLRRHGDQIEKLPGGYYRAQGRVDDTMNLGGIKVSSAEIERVLDTVPGVVRTAAIAFDPPGGGPSELIVYVVPTASDAKAESWRPVLQNAIKTRLNPLFRISAVVVIATLPVTASNKVMRRELRAQYRAQRAG